MSLAKKLRQLLFHVGPKSTVEASQALKGMPGRGTTGYAQRLRDWLAKAEAWFGEPVEVEYIDSPQDHGVDVLVTGHKTHARVGIQIKSDNDLRQKTFQRELKAQMTESRAFQVEQLIVVFACDPYPPNEAKIQYFSMEARRYHAPELVVVPPVRAAALLSIFDAPLVVPAGEQRGWPEFFDDVAQRPLISLYVDRWHPLLPEERFVQPACLGDVEASIAANSVTCIVGPPAAGKTFLAAHLAHRHWLSGKPVAWIAPTTYQLTDGPIATHVGPADARARIEALTRQLGLAERLPPSDSTDFVAKNFAPESLVYVEDPFGKTPAEYTTSLHTYAFFDLDELLRLLSREARASTRVVITSREGLFDRWLSERATGSPAGVGVVRLKADGYSFSDRLGLAEKLLQTRASPLDSSVSRTLARQLETPFELEQCVQSLPNGATELQVLEAAAAARKLRLAQATALVRPESDAERLFILCLSLMRHQTLGRGDTPNTYRLVFETLKLPGDSTQSLDAAIQKYSALVTCTPFDDNDPASRYEVEAVHSTVAEAAHAALRATCAPFMRDVAQVLPKLGHDKLDKYTAVRVFHELLALGIGTTASIEQDAFFELLSQANDPLGSGHAIVSILPTVDESFRRLLDEHLSKPKRSVALFLAELNSALNSETPSADGWRLALAMLRHPRMGATTLRFGHSPWDWAFSRWRSMPDDFETLLKTRLGESPQLVVHSMARAIVTHFVGLPDWMKASIHERSVASNGVVQGRLLIHLAEQWETVGPELQGYFRERAASQEGSVRAAAGTAALIFHDQNPAEFEAPSRTSCTRRGHPRALGGFLGRPWG